MLREDVLQYGSTVSKITAVITDVPEVLVLYRTAQSHKGFLIRPHVPLVPHPTSMSHHSPIVTRPKDRDGIGQSSGRFSAVPVSMDSTVQYLQNGERRTARLIASS
jgi:hypothetical protein